MSHAGSRCSITATPRFPGSSRTGPGVRPWARGAHLGLAETLLGGTRLLEPIALTPQTTEGAARVPSVPCPGLCLAPPRAFCSPRAPLGCPVALVCRMETSPCPCPVPAVSHSSPITSPAAGLGQACSQLTPSLLGAQGSAQPRGCAAGAVQPTRTTPPAPRGSLSSHRCSQPSSLV